MTEHDLNEKQWQYFKAIVGRSKIECLNEGWIEYHDLYNTLTEAEKFVLHDLGK